MRQTDKETATISQFCVCAAVTQRLEGPMNWSNAGFTKRMYCFIKVVERDGLRDSSGSAILRLCSHLPSRGADELVERRLHKACVLLNHVGYVTPAARNITLNAAR